MLLLNKSTFFFTIFFNFFWWLIESYVIPSIIGSAIASVQSGEENANRVLLYSFISYIFLSFFASALDLLSGWSFSKLSPNIISKIRELMFNNVQNNPYDYFLKRTDGEISSAMDVMSYNLSIVVDFLCSKIPLLLVFISISINFCFTNLFMGSTIIIWVFLHVLITLHFAKKIEFLSLKETKAFNELNGVISEEIKNQKIKEFLYLHEASRNKVVEIQEKVKNFSHKSLFTAKRVNITRGVVSVLFQGIFFNLLLFFLFKRGIISTSDFIRYINMNISIGAMIWSLSDSLPDFIQSFTKCSSVLHLLDDSNHNFRSLQKSIAKKPNGEIVVSNLSFSYAQDYIIKNFSLTIPEGSNTLILGYSGIGKSTLIDIIAGLIYGYKGKILYDGVSIKKMARKFLKKHCTVITNFGLFPGTVAYNIGLEKELDFKRINHLLQKMELAYLNPDQKIHSSSNCQFSDGEKQRLLIARGLYNEDCKVVLCDEPFKGLDFQSKNIIVKELVKFCKNKTLIVVDHSLSLVPFVDKIIFFGENLKIYTGTFQELVKKEKEFALFVKNEHLH